MIYAFNYSSNLFNFTSNLSIIMKYIVACTLFLLITFNSLSQNNHEFVSIKEKITGKRIELIAVNTNTISYDVFLMVETSDYRRSSSRPVLKTIPPNSEVRMITMVKLNGKEGKYNYTLVVNEISYDLSIKKDHENFEIKIDDALKAKKITLFTTDICDLCDETKNLLDNNRISYEEYNVDKDTTLLIKLIKEYKHNTVDTKTYAPILKIEDSLYTTIKTKHELIDALKNHF